MFAKAIRRFMEARRGTKFAIKFSAQSNRQIKMISTSPTYKSDEVNDVRCAKIGRDMNDGCVTIERKASLKSAPTHDVAPEPSPRRPNCVASE